MDRKNVVIVGSGSVKFTQGLIADMILSESSWELRLVDIDERALAISAGLAQKMIDEKEADIVLRSSLERTDMLPGADVVVVTIGVGGRRAWETDVFIPRKYGVYQPIGDTAMPGGISRALRMIPAMVDIAADVKRLCPNALFFNYANPMSVNCMAVHQVTGVNVIGLCIGVHEIERQLANIIGAPPEECTSLSAGLNHFTWIYDLRWNGEDVMPLLKHTIEGGSEAGLRSSLCSYLFDVYGAYPTVGDGHVMEFLPNRFPDGVCFGRPTGQQGHFEAIIAEDDTSYENITAIAEDREPLPKEIFEGSTWEHAQLVEIIDSIYHDKRERFTANVQNDGLISSLPPSAVLELSSAATSLGMRALQVPDFPAVLSAALLPKIGTQILTVEAALTGEKKLFIEALLSDGAVHDLSVAEKLCDELLMAHKDYLPQFA